MEVQLVIRYDELDTNGVRRSDELIRSIDRTLGHAYWEKNGEGWKIKTY